MRPLLVGEDNPYGSDPRYALYPEPPGSAGGRLCRLVLQLSVKDYIRGFDRANLCVGKWSEPEARWRAREIARARGNSGATLILLGAKVAKAFGLEFRPVEGDSEVFDDSARTIRIFQLPHPSGRCRAWNEPGAFERARDTLRRAGVLPIVVGQKATSEQLGELPSTVTSVARPAWCSNCHLVVAGEHCPECGPCL